MNIHDKWFEKNPFDFYIFIEQVYNIDVIISIRLFKRLCFQCINNNQHTNNSRLTQQYTQRSGIFFVMMQCKNISNLVGVRVHNENVLVPNLLIILFLPLN